MSSGDPWEGEDRGQVQFFAYPKQAPGTEPVYTFYNKENSEYTIHFGDAWEGEEKKDIAFYAFKEDVEGLELVAVYVYWNEGQKSHTFHFGSPWDGEVNIGSIAFYAFRYPE